MSYAPDLAALVDRLEDAWRALASSGQARRLIVGLVGEPGAGKSTLGAALLGACQDRGLLTSLVPMDGFHLANVELERLGRGDRKGAPDTFDAGGYAALLHRLQTARELVYAPIYDRNVEESIANALPVGADTQVVITEGNYLLLDGDWRPVRSHLDEVWALRVDDDVRRDRLVRRHEAFGKPPAVARAWVFDVDEPNARLIRSTFARAHLEIWEQPTS